MRQLRKGTSGSKSKYDHKLIEKKWQQVWLDKKLYSPDIKRAENKFYNLWMFPYPSAEGLHAGHAFASTGSDIYGRFIRMNGKEVFQPIGYDSFGIHSENFALKIGKHPTSLMEKTTKHYEEQMKSMGHGYDWTRTVATSDIDYYKWTQWLFVQLFKAGLAYKKKTMVNWCPSCKTVLADEQIVTPAQAGKLPVGFDDIADLPEGTRVCERCGSIPERKNLDQWMFRITYYADRLIDGFEKIDWSKRVVLAQKEWIGKSKGLSIDFRLEHSDKKITVWTKFWETVFGTTFLVVAPEHPIVKELKWHSGDKRDFQRKISQSLIKTEQQRKVGAGEKEGFFSGSYAINPVNGKKVPIWIADYVLMGVGTGAVMGVPAHDERDFDFAKKYALEIVQVVSYKDKKVDQKVKNAEMSFEGEGKLVNSGEFDGQDAWGEGKQKMAESMIGQGFAYWKTTYHLRDWLVSRQRYWGPPIPMIYCENCAREGKSYLSNTKPVLRYDQADWDYAGWYPVKEEDLPVELPNIKDYQPIGTGLSPLASHPEFYKVACPQCGEGARRETDVSDTFVDSSWYFLRYPSVDAESSGKLAYDPDITKKWLPVDLYFGGAEHSVLHLMYSRFVTKALYDLKYISFEEPFPKFFAHGLMIKDGAKMSKSRGNVVNPDEYVEKFGADTLRLYLMFMGPMDGYPDFRDTGIEGMRKFANRVWKIFAENVVVIEESDARRMLIKIHQTIKKVTDDIERFHYNTAISTLMEYTNFLEDIVIKNKPSLHRTKVRCAEWDEALKTLCLLMAPFAPHLTEELWQTYFTDNRQPTTHNFSSVHLQAWPKYNRELNVEDTVTIAVQVNGKLRGTLRLSSGQAINKDEVTKLAKENEKIAKWLEGKEIEKEIFVSGKLVNFVIG